MDDKLRQDIEIIIYNMRESADRVNSFDPKGNVEKLTDAATDLRQGANTIETLLKIITQLEDNPGLD